MPFCKACNSYILFGGKSDGGKRYCNDKCLEVGRTMNYVGDIPDDIIAKRAWQMRDDVCPRCTGPGPLDYFGSQRVISIVILTRTSDTTVFGCKRCGNRVAMQSTLTSLLAGWWGFPWGLIMTPIALVSNMVALLQSTPPGPSERLLEAAKYDMAAQLRERVELGVPDSMSAPLSHSAPPSHAMQTHAPEVTAFPLVDNPLTTPFPSALGSRPSHSTAGYQPASPSGLAISSLIFGILSIFAICLMGLSLLTSIVAVVTGHMAISQIKSSRGKLTGDGMAITGLVTGYFMLLISLLWVTILVIGFASSDRHAQRRPPRAANPRPAFQPAELPQPDLPQLDLPQPDLPQPEIGQRSNPLEPMARPDPFTPPTFTPPTFTPPTFQPPTSMPPRSIPSEFMPRQFGSSGVPVPPPPTFPRPDFSQPSRNVPKPITSPSVASKVPDNEEVDPNLVQAFPEMGWSVKSLAISPNKRFLAAGKMDAKLLILDLRSGKKVCEIDDLRNDMGQVTSVAFSRDGERVIAAGYQGAIASWAMDASGNLTDKQVLAGHKNEVQSLAISPTSNFIMSGSRNGQLVWQPIVQGSTVSFRQLDAFSKAVLAIHLPQAGLEAMASDGRSLVTVDLKNAKQLRTTPLQKDYPQAAAFSHDGSRLAITSGYMIDVYDTATATHVMKIDADHEIQWSVGFMPDGKHLYSGGRGRVTLWDAETGEPQSRLSAGGIQYIKAIAVSEDMQWLATIPDSAGQTLKVMEIPK